MRPRYYIMGKYYTPGLDLAERLLGSLPHRSLYGLQFRRAETVWG